MSCAKHTFCPWRKHARVLTNQSHDRWKIFRNRCLVSLSQYVLRLSLHVSMASVSTWRKFSAFLILFGSLVFVSFMICVSYSVFDKFWKHTVEKVFSVGIFNSTNLFVFDIQLCDGLCIYVVCNVLLLSGRRLVRWWKWCKLIGM